MIAIKGYREVGYDELHSYLYKAFLDSKKTHFKLSTDIGVQSTQTSINSLSKLNQKVSDKVLSKIMAVLGLNGKILWDNGTRYYYVKIK